MRMREWRDIYIQLKTLALELGMKLNDQQPEYASLHRSILSGLLTNIGFKTEHKEYTGAKQNKFYVFPGSHLFKKPPKWIVASEIVETGKNYARNVAAIDPAWLVDLASHLLSRSYFEPHWQKNSGQVGAFEKISLFGLVVVQKNRVNYGPIAPEESRDIFIRHALVYGEVKSPESFIRKNQQTIATIENEESKFRRPDLLLPEEHIIEFFNEIIPQGIYSWKHFKTWYGKNKKGNPDFLVLSEEQLLREAELLDSAHTHPEILKIGNFQFPLKYHFEPGSVDDGVTACVPLGLLAQLKPYWFEWLVPGLIKEKITLLIKSLPKQLRRNFVPAPDYAQKIIESCQSYQAPLLNMVCEKLNELGKGVVSESDFDIEKLPKYLFFNFALFNQEGKLVEQSRDLTSLQTRYAEQSEKEFEEMPLDQWEIAGITRWDFGDLPESREIESSMGKLTVYPGLVDEKDSVRLKYFPTRKEANLHVKMGLLRLVKLSMADKIRYLEKNLFNIEKQCLNYAAIGQCGELKQHLTDFVISETFLRGEKSLLTQQAFTNNLQENQAKLLEVANKACQLNLEALTGFNECKKKLKSISHPQFLEALSDIQEQLNSLVYRGYLANISLDVLVHYSRYFKAVLRRLDKLLGNSLLDRKHMLELRKYWNKYKLLKTSRPDQTQELEKLRWMIEEFRVSLWAQELKTPYPISAKRLDQQIKIIS